MHCITTLARLEEQREHAIHALTPLTKAERAKIDAEATASTQRAWDEYVASRKRQTLDTAGFHAEHPNP